MKNLRDIKYCFAYHSPLGAMTMASDGNALTGLWFDGQKHDPNLRISGTEAKELPIFRITQEWLDRYFGGKVSASLPAIRLEGSPFQLSVWNILADIPYGETVTYQTIAQEISRRKGSSFRSAQAVGNAVGRNPISILIPCHRVIGSDGSLKGYAGGLERKKALLAIEHAHLHVKRT